MRMKMKNKSHRYDINRPRPKHGHKYTKYKMCFSVMMTICIKPSCIYAFFRAILVLGIFQPLPLLDIMTKLIKL